LGEPLTAFHGGVRGWTIYRNGVDVSATLQAESKPLEDLTTGVTPNRVAIDLARGRFKFARNLLSARDIVTVDFGFEDPEPVQRTFGNLAQRLPRMMPAGVVPVLIDTRQTPVDPSMLE